MSQKAKARNEVPELRDYRALIRQGFALGLNPEATVPECQEWVREEIDARAKIGNGVATDVVRDEAAAMRALGVCPWCGAAVKGTVCQGGCHAETQEAVAATPRQTSLDALHETHTEETEADDDFLDIPA